MGIFCMLLCSAVTWKVHELYRIKDSHCTIESNVDYVNGVAIQLLTVSRITEANMLVCCTGCCYHYRIFFVE